MEIVNLQEGIDDVHVHSPAPRYRVKSGMQLRNINVSGFSPDTNDPSDRFNNMIAGYQSMDRLTDMIANSFFLNIKMVQTFSGSNCKGLK